MTQAPVSRSRRATSRLLLLAGYPMASWGTSRLRGAWRSGDNQPVLAFTTGTVAVTAGLVLRRKPILAAFNGVTAAVVAIAWFSRRRRHR